MGACVPIVYVLPFNNMGREKAGAPATTLVVSFLRRDGPPRAVSQMAERRHVCLSTRGFAFVPDRAPCVSSGPTGS